MEDFKTYLSVDPFRQDLNLRISLMDELYDRVGGVPDEPHRHDYYTVLIAEKAKGVHHIDFQSYPLRDGQLYFVSPGQIHQVIEEERSQGYALVFTEGYLNDSGISRAFVERLHLFSDYGESPPLEPDPEALAQILQLAGEIYRLYESAEPMREISIGAYLKLLLIQANNVCSAHPQSLQGHKASSTLLHQFKSAVDQHYREQHSVSWYADQLHVTADHLNRVVKSSIGKTAKRYIQSRIVVEAKRLMYYGDRTHKEIAYDLGFSEPANFSSFFKKCTGESPSTFVKKLSTP